MECKYFGECGSCTLFNLSYDEQLKLKINMQNEALAKFKIPEVEVFDSPSSNYRARAEFRIWHKEKKAFFAMGNISKDGVVLIEECPKVIKPIEKLLEPLIKKINSSQILKERLFGVEFLSGLLGDTLIVMLYHKRVDESWSKEAKELEESLGVSVIGRSRKQRIVLSKEFIKEKILVEDEEFEYYYFEGGFTQPNPFINQKMLSWAKQKAKKIGSGDLLEAYCGLGNFTIPLSREFERVLATEVSKTSIKNAKINLELNRIKNIEFARLSSKEITQAINGVREFNRLRGINLKEYNFSTILVDPPRAGLDSDTLNLASKMENIIYISCNLETLKRDLQTLTETHKIEDVALFDQFPYTKHIESGVFLRRKS